jgi:hypothetical protein
MTRPTSVTVTGGPKSDAVSLENQDESLGSRTSSAARHAEGAAKLRAGTAAAVASSEPVKSDVQRGALSSRGAVLLIGPTFRCHIARANLTDVGRGNETAKHEVEGGIADAVAHFRQVS